MVDTNEEGKTAENLTLEVPVGLDALPQDQQIAKLKEHVQAQAEEIEKQKKERDEHQATLDKIRQLIIDNYSEIDEASTMEQLQQDLVARAIATGKAKEDAEKEVAEKLAAVRDDPEALKGFIQSLNQAATQSGLEL